MFQSNNLAGIVEYFVLLDADEERYNKVYDRCRMSDIHPPGGVPNCWTFQFFYPDGREMKDLRFSKNIDKKKIRDHMVKAIKKIGEKGMPRSKFKKTWKIYEEAKINYFLKDYKEAKKLFEKLEKAFDTENPLSKDVKNCLESIEKEIKESYEKAMSYIESGDYEQGFVMLYELQESARGFKIYYEIKEKIKDYEKELSGNNGVDEAIDKAKDNQTAFKFYQKAHLYLFEGNERGARKYFEKITKDYPDTRYASLSQEKIEVELPSSGENNNGERKRIPQPGPAGGEPDGGSG